MPIPFKIVTSIHMAVKSGDWWLFHLSFVSKYFVHEKDVTQLLGSLWVQFQRVITQSCSDCKYIRVYALLSQIELICITLIKCVGLHLVSKLMAFYLLFARTCDLIIIVHILQNVHLFPCHAYSGATLLSLGSQFDYWIGSHFCCLILMTVM